MSNQDTQSNEDKRICIVLGCHRNYYKGGYCEPHYVENENSPTQSDKTVEEILIKLELEAVKAYREGYTKKDTFRAEAIAALTARENRTAKEARIDEWEKAPLETALPQGGKRRFFYISNHYRKQRLAELQENTDEA